MPGFPVFTDFMAYSYAIDLNSADPVQAAGTLQVLPARQRPQFLINCQHLACLRTHGVSHLVSQLLATRQAGVEVQLYDVDPVLSRALRLFGLYEVFQVLPSLPAL